MQNQYRLGQQNPYDMLSTIEGLMGAQGGQLQLLTSSYATGLFVAYSVGYPAS